MAVVLGSDHDDAAGPEPEAMAAYLRQHLGWQVAEFVMGAGASTRPSAAQLRAAYEATRLLVDAYGDETAPGWLLGTQEAFDDQAPATVLRESSDPEQLALVVTLARAFAGPVGSAPASS